MIKFPDTMPGHWHTAEGREMAETYLATARAMLAKSDLPDFMLANAQYLETMNVGTVTVQSAIAMQTAAKERIRWLSAHLAAHVLVAGDAAIIIESLMRELRISGHVVTTGGRNISAEKVVDQLRGSAGG